MKSKSLSEHIFYLRQIFHLLVKKNINLNSIKIFLHYFEITLLKQRINAFELSIIEKKLKAFMFLTPSNIFAKLKIYLELTNYITQYIHFYVSIFRSFQNLKTILLKLKFKNDAKRKSYTSKAKLLLTSQKEVSFLALQKAINKTAILIHFDFDRVL